LSDPTGAHSAAWRPTLALLCAAATGGALLFGGVALHRPDLVALAAPLLTWLLVHLGRLGGGPLRVRLRGTASTLLEEQGSYARVRVTPPAGTDLLTVNFVPGDWLTSPDALDAVVAAGPGETPVEFVVTARRWAHTSVGLAQVTAWGGQGLFCQVAEASGTSVKILPYRERFTVSDVLPVTTGLVGAHRSRRPGEGTDLAGIRPFQVGDRLKRINWPVSLRTGTLHVTATVTDLDATVMIVLDSSTDLVPGDDPARLGGTLDTAVHAAAALAEHYLRAGDRVGLIDDGPATRTVLPAAGRAHLDRIVDALIDVDTSPGRRTAAMHLAAVLGRVAPRAMVILITPLLELARPELAVEIARSGHTVLVIDSLGQYAAQGPPGSTTDLAWRLQRLQHDVDIDRLADVGIPTVSWQGSGSLNTALARLSRASAAPRLRR
jgi:uncharacterized protein (DUF58 family)